MKNQRVHILLLVMMLGLVAGCKDYFDKEKYKRPDWLPGKLYTTVAAQENLTMFAECLRLAALDSIIDVSGSWSVFAPTDEAMKEFLAENHYASVSDIPPDELERIAEFHIVQNPWSFEQLQSLSAYGWKTGDDTHPDSYAYKRQTIFKNPDEKYWVSKNRREEVIVQDSTETNRYKKVFVESRKYVPIFYDDFMANNGLTSEDYSFYFDRPYEPGNVFYAGAKILESDILAENGFLHIIDKVVDPMLNGKELLENENPGESYKLFLDMIYWYYPNFSPNMPATFNQPEVRRGGLVDTLWDLNYARLRFDIHRESTGFEGPETNLTMERHNGLIAPADAAFREFIDGTLTVKSGFPHWRDYKSLPIDVVDIIVAQNLKSSPLYPSKNQFRQIFRQNSRFRQNEEGIIRKEFGSNCTFIGLGEYTPDRVFTSVTAPVFLRPNFTLFRLAMLYTDAHDIIANHDGELLFFPIPDHVLNADSSLLLNWIDKDENRYNFSTWNRLRKQVMPLWGGALTNMILNQVGTTVPNGSAKKEFIQTLGGRYITWDHSDNTIQGTFPSVANNTGEIVICTPALLDEPTDNGKAWSVECWFNFSGNNLKTVLSSYSTFYNLLNKAGLVDEAKSKIVFANESEKYTVFVPTNEALAQYRADTLSIPELRNFLKYHFLQGEIIFTDNKKPSGNYHAANGGVLEIKTGPDIIEIPGKKGNTSIRIIEKEQATNIMASEKSVVSAVVHEINHVLIPD